MRTTFTLIIALLLLANDSRATDSADRPKDTNTPRDFPKVGSKDDWQKRAASIREQILVSAGLWLMPIKTPLRAKVFDKFTGDGFSVEKVILQPWPGFYLTGNLYRPLGKGAGPFPGVLNAHGHFPTGRFTDTAVASVPARCVSFARQGMVAFAYDMVGFGETRFADSPADATASVRHSAFASAPVNQLWNISLMGLQTWDSLRALDFLQSLPDVDKTRLACTGESGGGTQTYLLGAIDCRLAAQAPVNMVSHIMQGGCRCENAPGLRVEYSNMEIAAAAAPRPQIMVAATGDWTKSTPTIEGPAVESVYRLFGAQERLRYIQFNAPHNYNKESREAVYAWFDRWLLGAADSMSVPEQPYEKVPESALTVWPGGQLPSDALRQQQLIDYLKQDAVNRWKALLPRNQSTLAEYREIFLPEWRHVFQLEWPRKEGHFAVAMRATQAGWSSATVRFAVPGKSNEIRVLAFAPVNQTNGAPVVVLADTSGGSTFADVDGNPGGLVRQLVSHGDSVWVVREFSGETPGDPLKGFFTTYNRTISQERVRDLSILASSARAAASARVAFYGRGHSGLWMLMAAPVADAVAADCCALNCADDEAWLDQEIFAPGLLSLGGFEGMAALAAPHPLLLENTGTNFQVNVLRKTYSAARAARQLQARPNVLEDGELAAWISASVKN
jgi:hypothetical protein